MNGTQSAGGGRSTGRGSLHSSPDRSVIRVRRLTFRICWSWASSATIVVIDRPRRTSRTDSSAGPTHADRRKLVDMVRTTRPDAIDSAPRTASAHM